MIYLFKQSLSLGVAEGTQISEVHCFYAHLGQHLFATWLLVLQASFLVFFVYSGKKFPNPCWQLSHVENISEKLFLKEFLKKSKFYCKQDNVN